MGNLKMALAVAGILELIYGALFLFPSVAASVFEYQPMDMGLLSTSAALFLGMGVLTLAASAQADKVAGIAWAFALGQVIGLVQLVWQYAAGVFTLRTALVPAVLTAVLAIWIGMAKPQK